MSIFMNVKFKLVTYHLVHNFMGGKNQKKKRNIVLTHFSG